MITDTTAKKTYIIEDGVVSYPIGFVYQLNVDGTPQIKLYLNNHPETPLVYEEDYELSGDGLNVVLLDNYEVGDKLHILRNIPNRQLSNYVIGRVDPEQIESDFDEAVMRDQQLQAEIDLFGELPMDHEYRLTVIEDEIPAEASAENQLADKAFVNTHINNTSNPHGVTKAQVGLGNCDNTADLDKPISTATQSALDGKQATISDLTDIRSGASAGATAVQPGDLATVATSGDYGDLLNKPTIPAAQVNSDWNANSGVAQILNKPTIPTVNDATITITQGGITKGTFTTNQSSASTIALDAGGGGDGYHPDLFDWKWADHEINDMQWLNANTFSWQDGTVYSGAYNHLVSDISGKTLQTETIGATTVSFYLADDGHKICPDTQESNVSAIYTATGLAWYYILDTVNQRFKLPRSAYEVNTANLIKTEDLSTIENVTFPYTATKDGVILGCLKYVDQTVGSVSVNGTVIFDSPTKYNGGYLIGWESINIPVKVGDVVTISGFDNGSSRFVEYKKPTTNNILYFYVGSFTQSAIENTAGLNASLFNSKADIDLNNVSAGIDFVVESQLPTAQNNYTWYRKYKSGWVEMGGEFTQTANSAIEPTITFPVELADTHYMIVWSAGAANTTAGTYFAHQVVESSKATTGCQVKTGNNNTTFTVLNWQVSYMAAS